MNVVGPAGLVTLEVPQHKFHLITAVSHAVILANVGSIALGGGGKRAR